MRGSLTGFAAMLCAAALILCADPSPAAAVSAYQEVLQVYQSSGTVPACRFTPARLQQAQRGIDTYGAQYFADFATAISSALAKRASGGCEHRPAGSLNQLAPVRNFSGRGLVLRPITAATGASAPLPLLLAAVLTAVGLLGSLALSGAGSGLWDNRLTRNARHLAGEAGYRMGALRSDLGDWLSHIR